MWICSTFHKPHIQAKYIPTAYTLHISTYNMQYTTAHAQNLYITAHKLHTFILNTLHNLNKLHTYNRHVLTQHMQTIIHTHTKQACTPTQTTHIHTVHTQHISIYHTYTKHLHIYYAYMKHTYDTYVHIKHSKESTHIHRNYP